MAKRDKIQNELFFSRAKGKMAKRDKIRDGFLEGRDFKGVEGVGEVV